GRIGNDKRRGELRRGINHLVRLRAVESAVGVDGDDLRAGVFGGFDANDRLSGAQIRPHAVREFIHEPAIPFRPGEERLRLAGAATKSRSCGSRQRISSEKIGSPSLSWPVTPPNCVSNSTSAVFSIAGAGK